MDSSRRGQSGGKNTNAPAIMIHGNIPMGNRSQVITWNTASTAYAEGLLRLHNSQPTIVRSKAAPDQLIAYATQASFSRGPTNTRSPLLYSQIRSGWACRIQSGFSLAIPANK